MKKEIQTMTRMTAMEGREAVKWKLKYFRARARAGSLPSYKQKNRYGNVRQN